MQLKIAYTTAARTYFSTGRQLVQAEEADYADVAALVATDADKKLIHEIYDKMFGIPIFVVLLRSDSLDPELEDKVMDALVGDDIDKYFSNEIETAAKRYEEKMLPPFFANLKSYVELKNSQFDCPGHQGGQYFRKHPAGKVFYDFYGENIFRSDICNADVELGDMLIHEGPPEAAQKYAAKVFNADKTYYVLNGTTTANTIAINAVVTPGDLVLFDRNNHKSVYNAALLEAEGIAVYLETARNPLGFIGGIDDHCFEESYVRELAAKVNMKKAKAKRPFRLAVIQLGTYDGTIYNARQVVDRIGHLCDYILFDSAWVGYEQFIPMMRDCSPLLLELTKDDPGILVTQSIHKQQAGFSQASQIHKKDSHIRGQKRYIEHKRFNSSFRMYMCTSPFYPLFASLDVNARIQDGDAGRKLWDDCLKLGIEARKAVLKGCTMLKPFIMPTVRGKKWEDYDTDEIASNIEFFRFKPGEKWHSFEGYAENQYFVDPNKFMLTTPGIDSATGEYEDFGIPASILADYMRENGIIPEKNDFNSILFLMTPAETQEKVNKLVAKFIQFEQHVKEDSLLCEVLPTLYYENSERYSGYTIRMLCKEMHEFYKAANAKEFQKQLFREEFFPQRAMPAHKAYYELIRNNAKLVNLDEILGKIALEGALPYPPGIYCVVPGERWNETSQKYFQILLEGINRFPGFAPEIQGLYLEKENGVMNAYGYVYEKGRRG